MADKSMDGLNTFTDQSADSAIDTSRIMRVGIIGCGWIADAHVKALLNQPDAQIVACADLVPGRVQEFCKRNGIDGLDIKEYPSHKEMLDDESL